MSKEVLDHEQLVHDPMVDTYAKVAGFFQTHRMLLAGILGGSLLLLAGFIGYDLYSKSQEEKAALLLSFAEKSFNNGDFEAALKGNEAELTPGFEKIASGYSSTNSGNLALYYAAVCEFNLGNGETALAYIESFDFPEGILGLSAMGFYANLKLDAGKAGEAAEVFEKASVWVESETTSPYYLAKAAQAFLDAGSKKDARRTAEKLLDTYPNATEAAQGQKIMAMVE